MRVALTAAQSQPELQHLLWFRPLSPLNYTIPDELAALTWGEQSHVPIDMLSPLALSPQCIDTLLAAQAWFLSSPTAAHCLAAALRSAGLQPRPTAIAVVGHASLRAWQAAGGSEAQTVLLSDSGESMGLLAGLRRYASVCVVRAQSGREELPSALGSAGVRVGYVAAYQKTPDVQFCNHLLVSAQASSMTKVLCFTSTDQVTTVEQAASQSNALGEALVSAKYWASHPRIATAAKAAGFKPFIAK